MTRLPGDTGSTIMLSVAPHDIDFFNKLLEGYDNLAMVTTIDAPLRPYGIARCRKCKKRHYGNFTLPANPGFY